MAKVVPFRAPWFQPSEFERDDDLARLAREHLGHQGKMVGASKGAYSRKHPDHKVVYNANVVVQSKLRFQRFRKPRVEKVWYGDLDLTLESVKVQNFANTLGRTVYVLYESAAQFKTEHEPDLYNPAGIYQPQPS